MKQIYWPIPSILIVLIAVLVNFDTMLRGITPSTGEIFMSLAYIVIWIFLIAFAIKKYYSVMLIFYTLFWFVSFLSFVLSSLITLMGSKPYSFMEYTNIVFYTPFYGFNGLIDTALLFPCAGVLSLIFAIASMICIRRSPNALSRKEIKRMQKEQDLR